MDPIIVIGNKRSGTTFLREALSRHPDINWQRKGYYFLDDQRYDGQQFRDEWARNATDPNRCMVEVCEHLLIGQINEDVDAFEKHRFVPDTELSGICRLDPAEVARRIKNEIPNARIVALLRNQVDWVRTHYRVALEHLPKSRHRLSDFLSSPEGRIVSNGAYYAQNLEAYFKTFGKENVGVFFLERIRQEPIVQINEIFDFIGVPPQSIETTNMRRNSSGSDKKAQLRRLLADWGVTDPMIEFFRPLKKTGLQNLMTNVVSSDLLSASDIEETKNRYSRDNAHLAELLKIDVESMGFSTQ